MLFTSFYTLSDSRLWFILTPKSSIFPEITFRHPSKLQEMLKHPTMPGISSVLLYSLRTWGIIAMQSRTLQSNWEPACPSWYTFLATPLQKSMFSSILNLFQRIQLFFSFLYFWSLRKHEKSLAPWLSPSQQCLANRCSRPRPKGTRSASMSH